MVSNSAEYIGIAEGIRSMELIAKQRIERLERVLSELNLLCLTLEDQIDDVDALIAEEMMCSERSDDDDAASGPDFLRIHMLDEDKAALQEELDEAQCQIIQIRDEISECENQILAAQIERDRVLVEIQDRAAVNAAGITQAGSAVGAFASIGSKLQSSLRSTQDTLAVAARILGGTISSAGGGLNGGIGSRRGGAVKGPAGSAGAFLSQGDGTSSNGSYTSRQSSSAAPSASTFSSPAAVKELAPTANYVSTCSSSSVSAQNFKAVSPAGNGGGAKYQSTQRSGVSSGNASSRKAAAPSSQETKTPASSTSKFRLTEYQATYSYTDPTTHEKKTASSPRRVYEYTELNMNLVIPAGTSFGNGRSTTKTQTNLERMLNGDKPFVLIRDENGNTKLVLLELHHLTGEETLLSSPFFNGTDRDGTMVELPQNIHDKYDKQIHMKGLPSFRKSYGRKRDVTRSADSAKYTNFTKQYWRDRAEKYIAAKGEETAGIQPSKPETTGDRDGTI